MCFASTKFSLSNAQSHCARNLLIVKKIRPNLNSSKIIPFEWVDLNCKIKFAICHWTWEIGYIWHLQRKSGSFMSINIWWLIAIAPSLREVAWTSSKKSWCYLTWPEFCHQIFLKSAEFNLSPKSNDKLQILFWNSNLLIQLALLLMESNLVEFFHY